MKKSIFTAFSFLAVLTCFGQNGIKEGAYFLLQNERDLISINFFENEEIREQQSFKISKKSIYTTDQQERVAVLDTAKNQVSLYNFRNLKERQLKIPYDIKPKTILLTPDNLFIGGEMGKEMLVQYHLGTATWYQLQIPAEVQFIGKAIDDLVINEECLIAIDNLIMPKYVLFYKLNSDGRLDLFQYKELKSNGAYESIHQARLTDNYLGLLSGTYSGYVGATEHITVYEDLDLKRSFALSSNEQERSYHTFTDFAIVEDELIIASKERGLGIFRIRNSDFKGSDDSDFTNFNSTVRISRIKYTAFENETIKKITLIPNTQIIVLTMENKKGELRHQLKKM